MKEIFRKKLKSKAGMTLGEVLVAVIILLLMTAIVAGGIPVAHRAYVDVVDAGNAEVLLSTTLNVIRRELSSATRVHTAGGKIYFLSGETGFWTEIRNGGETDDGTDNLVFVRYHGVPGDFDSVTTVTPLVTDQAATTPLRSSITGIAYSGGVFVVTGVSVTRGTQEMSKLDSYKIAPLNGVTEE
ncbi:MAG: type II secretion system protein [Clostridia bacterium]|nr:type II secretion system protein [Clostridia bacterium]